MSKIIDGEEVIETIVDETDPGEAQEADKKEFNSIQEAVKSLMNAVDAVEYAEEFSYISRYIATAEEAIQFQGENQNWKEKYDKVYADYKRRFEDMIDSSMQMTMDTPKETRFTERDIRRLTFDGSNE